MLKNNTKVLITNYRTHNMHSEGYMDKYMGKIMTIRSHDTQYAMYEDINDPHGVRMNGGWYWDDDDIEKVVNV